MAKIDQKIDLNAKIAVLCGGMSSEAAVSRRSGKNCLGALQRLGYKNSELVEVDKISLKNYKRANTIMHTMHFTANTERTVAFRGYLRFFKSLTQVIWGL